MRLLLSGILALPTLLMLMGQAFSASPSADLRRAATHQDLQALLDTPNDRFDDWAFLFDDNAALCPEGHCPDFWTPGAPAFESLARPQQVLALLGILDREVQNGGLGQFYVNHPTALRQTADAVDALGHAEFARRFHEPFDRFAASPGLRETFSAKRLESDRAYDRGDGDAAAAAYTAAIDGIVGPRNPLGIDEFSSWYLAWRASPGGYLDAVRGYIRAHQADLVRFTD